MIAIRKTKEKFGWLGNMSAYPIAFKEKIFPTAEHLFQAMRFENQEIIDKIAAIKSPMVAKMFAKSQAEFMKVVPRSNEDIKNMVQVLAAKFAQHPNLMKELIETGKEEIVEDCTNRPNISGLFWGKAKVDNEWTGNNTLGKLLMTLRENYRQNGE